MKIEIDDFVLENVFNHEPAREGVDEFWWRSTNVREEGYIMIWADGTSHHTYHYPPEIHA